jgi:flagellar biosynthesis chaperone FliJ
MKTRFSSLVRVKKNSMQKSENAFEQANRAFLQAKEALQNSLDALGLIAPPSKGQIADFLANRTLLDAQRALIRHNEEWAAFSQEQLQKARQELQQATVEYEKFKYLEFEEQKALLKKAKIQEAKDLDEIALMTYSNKDNKKAAS